MPAIGDIAWDRRGREHENDGEADQQNIEGDLVRRLLPFGALDQPDHAVEEGRAWRRRDAHADPIGQHLRAAGDGGAVAARLADHRRRFAGNCRFVDRGHARDHLAVRRNRVSGFNQHHVSNFEVGRGHQPIVLRVARAAQKFGAGFGALPTQRFSLGLAAALGDRFREVGEQNGEPQPQDDLEFKADMCAANR
jgi:hypothetical protein